MLRAPPKPQKDQARTVVQQARDRLAGLKGSRAQEIGKALAELSEELGR